MKENEATVYDISKSNWSNSNLFPKDLLIDTNAIINAISKRNGGVDIERYLNELAKRGSSIYWYHKIEEELHDFYHVDEYMTKAKREGFFFNGTPNWKHAENVVATEEAKVLSRNALNRTETALSFLKNHNGMCLPVKEEDYKDLSKAIYSNYGGNRKDSEHIAVANEFEINNFITMDTSNGNGFMRYPNINIYGNSQIIKSNYNQSTPYNNYIDFSELTQVTD